MSSDADSFTSRQIFMPNSPHTGNGRASTATPPYHWHLEQSETFSVQSGVLTLIADGKERTLRAGEKFTSPPGQRHTFFNGSKTEPLDVHITVRGGEGAGFDETFVR